MDLLYFTPTQKNSNNDAYTQNYGTEKRGVFGTAEDMFRRIDQHAINYK